MLHSPGNMRPNKEKSVPCADREDGGEDEENETAAISYEPEHQERDRTAGANPKQGIPKRL